MMTVTLRWRYGNGLVKKTVSVQYWPYGIFNFWQSFSKKINQFFLGFPLHFAASILPGLGRHGPLTLDGTFEQISRSWTLN